LRHWAALNLWRSGPGSQSGRIGLCNPREGRHERRAHLVWQLVDRQVAFLASLSWIVVLADYQNLIERINAHVNTTQAAPKAG
jgi:hypothetical protein